MSEGLWPFHLFDPKSEFLVVERRLPHWAQAGALCFITWRTHDSIPEPVLATWRAERYAWLRRHGIDPGLPDCKLRLGSLKWRHQVEFFRAFADRWHEYLDACHGACVLRRQELAAIVVDSLKHFDDARYTLTDLVVMPNHVHLLAAFPDGAAMLPQCESWKRFSATQINRRLGRRGRFWQQDGFDHLVRSEEQFDYLRRYIAENAPKAHLRPGEYVHYSKPWQELLPK